MIKALVCFQDILLKQPLVITVSEIQTFTFNRLILTKPVQNCLDRADRSPRHVLKNNRLVMLWFGWLTGITILNVAAPVLAVQSEAKFDEAVDIYPQAAMGQVAAIAVFPASPLLVSQAGYLQLGDSGAAVTDLQNRLAALGYYRGPIDGDFGSQTQNAVRQFQQAQRLTADGVVGPATDSALRRSGTTSIGSNSGSPALPQGRFSIAELQRRLQSRGFYQGPIDGVIGTQTRTAIGAAQRAYGVTERDILNGSF